MGLELKKRIVVLLTLFLLLYCPTASATKFEVISLAGLENPSLTDRPVLPASVSGSDQTFTGIQEAIDNSSPGDSIYVAPGIYSETVLVNKQVYLLGAKHGVDPAGSLDRGDESIINGGKCTITASGAEVNGFKFDSWQIMVSGAENVSISHNIIVNAVDSGGIYIRSQGIYSDGAYIGYNTISASKKYGICNVYNSNVVIEHNHILNVDSSESPGHGIGCIGHLGDNIQILNNTLLDIPATGIDIWAGAGSTISNNSISYTGKHGIFIDQRYGGHTVSNNDISYAGQSLSLSGCAIRVDNSCLIEENVISNSREGIRTHYNGSGPGDRVEISSNDISYISYPGINVLGMNTYVYDNAVYYCNNYGFDGTGDWNYASIHIEPTASYSLVIGNVVYDGINGIQTWADSVTITNNIVYGMGNSYATEKFYAGRMYYNSAILVGSNWYLNNHSPEGVIIYNNSVYDNYINLYYNNLLEPGVDASCNWWGTNDATIIPTRLSDNVDYTPWLYGGNDINPGQSGFQGNMSQICVDDDSPQMVEAGRIQEAINDVSNGGTIRVSAGTYEEMISLGGYWESEDSGSAATADNKTVILLGAQANVEPSNADDRPGGESLILGRVKFNTNGSGAALNGFKLDGSYCPEDKSALFVQRGPGAQISYNVIINSDKHGIETGWLIDDAPNVVIKYNAIVNSNQNAIENYSFDDGVNSGNSGMQVLYNIIDSCQGHGVVLPPTGYDHLIKGNIFTNCGLGTSFCYPILNNTRAFIDSNTISDSHNGILTTYEGSGPGDRAEIKNNTIFDVEYPGVVLGSLDSAADGSGAHTFVYNNTLFNCNHTGLIDNDNWKYGSIMIGRTAVSSIIQANTIYDGVKGITVYADSIRIENNRVYNMGLTYDDEVVYDGETYCNCGIQVGEYSTEKAALNIDPADIIIFNNSIRDNYVNLYHNDSLMTGVNASANWWGSNNSEFVAATVSNRVDYTPWLSIASDVDAATPGFQGYFAVLWVDDNCIQMGDIGYIQEAVDLIDGSTIYLMDGIYRSSINIVNKSGINIVGQSKEGTLYLPMSTLDWDLADYGGTRQAAIRVVGSQNITFKKMTLDFDFIKGENIFGVVYWNSTGELSNNAFKNMSSGENNEVVSYFRAPNYTNAGRAEIDLLNNTFYRTGEAAVVAHDFVNMNVYGNEFDQGINDFGSGLRLGSAAGGTIRANVFKNYDDWETVSQTAVSAIAVDNAFTEGMGVIEKNIVIDSNEIYSCQYGIYIGDESAADVANASINVSIKHNSIHDNSVSGSMSSGGIVLFDDNKDAGSSLTAFVDSNNIIDNGDIGLIVYTVGNGDITAFIRNNWFISHFKGIVVKDYGSQSTSSYNLIVHGNFLDNSVNAENDVVFGYWDDGISSGNCWADYDGDGSGPYIIPGNAGAIDRYPNVYCGDCIPGDANGNEIINLLDITYIINYLYKEGTPPTPYETCSGDPNTNCVVNLLDITYLIAALYQGGPAPGSGLDWFVNCDEPFYKSRLLGNESETQFERTAVRISYVR